MAATSGPYGLRSVGETHGRVSGHRKGFVLPSNNSAAIYFGDIVSMTSGVLASATGTPTTTRSANTPVGVFVGCQYVDPINGLRTAQYLPANAISNLNYTNVILYVEDDPSAEWQVQADGQVPTTAIGKNAALKNFGGSTTTGNSSIQLDSGSIATTNTLAVRIISLVNAASTIGGGSVPNDAYTDVIVRFNAGVHAYGNATGA